MSYRITFTVIFGLLCFGSVSSAHEHEMVHPSPSTPIQEMSDTNKTFHLEISPLIRFIPGKTATLTLRLFQNKHMMTLKDLKEVHTQKLHLLIIDPSLSDYHHIHPTEGNNAGEFMFEFTPNKSDGYRVWADITPLATNQQKYVRADIGMKHHAKVFINKKVNTVSTVDGYTFNLTLDSEPQVGKSTMASVIVTKDGKPFTELEPVMGAFAHVVGFSADYNSVLHIHPMGKEPTKNSDRGGATLKFHIEPKKSGFVKIFAQVKIHGKELFVPFGILVS